MTIAIAFVAGYVAGKYGLAGKLWTKIKSLKQK